MHTFREYLLGNFCFVSGLEKRGFELDLVDGEYENNLNFRKVISASIYATLHLTPWNSTAFRCKLIISSIDVIDCFRQYNLFLDQPEISDGCAYDVLATDLLWLKWNENPDSALKHKSDYILDDGQGFQRMFSDLDSVGALFLDDINSQRKLADFLISLEEYPRRIKWGGEPKSSDPFIFACALYLSIGDKEDAIRALNFGLKKYGLSEHKVEWEEYRLERFQERRNILIGEMGEN